MIPHVVTFILAAIIVQLQFPQSCHAQSPPLAPIVEKGICPYEFGCDYIKWVAKVTKRLFKNDGDSASVAFTMSPGDSLTFNYGNMHIDQIGIVHIVRMNDKYPVGDTIYVLSYTGEGSFDIWYKGTIHNVEEFWSDDAFPDTAYYYAGLLAEPSMTWWVSLTNSSGITGWLPLVNTCHGACFGEGIVDCIPKNNYGF